MVIGTNQFQYESNDFLKLFWCSFAAETMKHASTDLHRNSALFHLAAQNTELNYSRSIEIFEKYAIPMNSASCNVAAQTK
jgi:hypothetical protein